MSDHLVGVNKDNLKKIIRDKKAWPMPSTLDGISSGPGSQLLIFKFNLILTTAGKSTNKLSTLISLKWPSVAKLRVKISRIRICNAKLRFAQPL